MADKNFISFSSDSIDTNDSTIYGVHHSLPYICDIKTKTKLKKDALEYVDYYKEYKLDPKYKTEMCKSWSESGFCPYGNKCRFAHGKGELFEKIVSCKKYKQKDCMSFFKNKYCCYGSRCHFRHEERKLGEMNRSYYNYLLSNLSNTSLSIGDLLELENEVVMLLLSANKPAKSGGSRLPAFNKIFQSRPVKEGSTGNAKQYANKSKIKNQCIPGLNQKEKQDTNISVLNSSFESSEQSEKFSISYFNYNILPLF